MSDNKKNKGPAAGNLVHKANDFRDDKPVRILIVDDEEIVRSFLFDVLSDEGYEVTAVSSGEEAVKLLKKDTFYLIITDIKMPGMNGMQVLRTAKEMEPNQNVIVMTGYASTETAVESMKLGAADYITKPFNLDQIRIVVAKTLERSRLRRRAEEGEIYKQLSRIDGLTELFNYAFFQQLLKTEIERAQRYGHELSLLMIDIDDFKGYNDRNGHPAGDEALKHLSRVMSRAVRGCDFIARYGGDEFVVVLPETDLSEAKLIGERLRLLVEQTEFENELANKQGLITVSVGLATYPHDAQTKEDLIKRADEALYKAKALNRNKLCVFSEVDN
ncbi:diguanylate cyclase [bacterium]|nr:diguanylate cyclase [bacterium]